MNNDQVIRELRVDSDGIYTFDFLGPGSYTFTFIHDLNDNGKWDTGRYLEGRQPEYVEKITKAISVRSNWDHEVPIRLKH
jgi:hypothetical protein